MADPIAIREALAANLAAITGLQVSPWMLSNPTTPTAHMWAETTEFDKAGSRGLDLIVLTVQVLVGAVSDIGGQKNLAEYRAGSGPRSVKEKLEADSDLGGACDDLRVTQIGPDRVFVREGGGQLFGAEFRVEVYAQG